MSTRISPIIATQVALNKLHHQPYFPLGQLVAERDHSIAAVGDVLMDLVVGLVFVLAIADVGDDPAIFERLALTLRPVADRAVLTKERRLVGFAACDGVSGRFRLKTSEHRQAREQYDELEAKYHRSIDVSFS
jgi:hypothetical protein